MTCRRLDLGNGDFAIVCSRGQRRVSCQEPGCVDERVALCDYPLGGARAGKTCSRKVCERHRVRVGKLDFCPTHARIWRERNPGLALGAPPPIAPVAPTTPSAQASVSCVPEVGGGAPLLDDEDPFA